MKISLISTATFPSDQGIREVSSYLKEHGYETEIIFLCLDENYKKNYSLRVLKHVEKLVKGSDIIGIASYASTAFRAKKVIKYLRKLGKPIIWGGIHATISPEDCIKEADYVCIGEGEGCFLDFVKAVENKKNVDNIPNLWVRKKRGIIRNPVRPLIGDLDKLPFPDYDIENHYVLDRRRLRKFKEGDLGGQIFFLTGRGCPYGCTYCSNHQLNELYRGKGDILRWHSPDYIVRGILYMKEKFKSLGYFDIRDDTFSFRSLEQIKEFCERYKEKVGMRFKCLGDPRTIDEEKIRLLVDAGCTDIIIGIQGSERINLEVYRRYQTDADVIGVADILNKYKNRLAVMYDVITCNPYENNEDILSLIKLLMKLPKPYYLSVNNLVFFTGSSLYKKAKRDEIIKNEEDSATQLNYWDRFKHIKLKRKNEYLTLILNLMRGVVTGRRYGLIPASLLKKLIEPERIEHHSKNKGPTYVAGNVVGGFDWIRENVGKPIYREMTPTRFKIWFDKIRYRV